MQRTREELEELLLKSKESVRKSKAATRKLKAVMTKVSKVVGPKRPVKRKAPK